MDALLEEHAKLEKKGNLRKSIDDVQKTIDLLISARNSVASNPQSAATTLAKLQQPVKKSLDTVNDDLKEIYSSINKYSKALDKKFKDKPLPSADNDALSSHPHLINRAIAMHLLREGQFGVASTFISECSSGSPAPLPYTPSSAAGTTHYDAAMLERDLVTGSGMTSESLQQQFTEMYHILRELREARNLAPAIAWARSHSAELEHRGSSLEFALCRLQFVSLFLSRSPELPLDAESDGPARARAYARSNFGSFGQRYLREIEKLAGALGFYSNIPDSPYTRLFDNDQAWEEVASSFTKEFCSLLGLSADSPLYVAATAGAIALPTLLKLQTIMKEKRTEWTTADELPVEIPLPQSYLFHSIFVCPVSKEQTTDANPPMMMPCGHVIAKESLERLSKGAKFKCPYCPGESHPRDAKKVIL